MSDIVPQPGVGGPGVARQGWEGGGDPGPPGPQGPPGPPGPPGGPSGGISVSTTLPVGTEGQIFLFNSTPININLPLDPRTLGQRITFKDAIGIGGDAGVIINGNGTTIDGLPIRSMAWAYNSLTLAWGGLEWNILDQWPSDISRVFPSVVNIRSDGSITPAARMDALINYMNIVSGTPTSARYPKLGGRPLFFTSGDVRTENFYAIITWGAYTQISGTGVSSVLDNIGINLCGGRGIIIEDIFLGKRDRVIVPGSYGIWYYGSIRQCNVRNLNISHREFGIVYGDERKSTTNPGQEAATSIAQTALNHVDTMECDYGHRVYYGQYNTAVGGHVIANKIALDVYCGGLGRWIGTELKGNDANLRVRCGSRGSLTDSYLIATEMGGGGPQRQIPIIGVVNDGGFCRFILSTSINSTVSSTASSLTWYDPIQRRAYSMLTMLGSVVGGEVTQIVVGGTFLLASPVLWQGTITATITAIVAAVNAQTPLSGWMAMAAGARMYLDSAVKDNDAQLGLSVSVSVANGMVLNPDLVVPVTAPGHGYTINDVKNEVEFNYNAETASIQGSINGPVLTVTRIWNNDHVPLNIPIVGETFGAANRVVTSPIQVNADGTGTYNLSAAAGIQPSQTITIGHSGVCPIRAMTDSATLWTDVPNAFYLTPTGTVTRHFRLSSGLLHVNIFNNGETQVATNVGITEVTDTSILTDVPFATVPSVTNATVRVDRWDSDLLSMDTAASRINDIQNIGGNRNNELHRSTDHIQYVGTRLKTAFWIDNRANDAFKTRRLIIIRSGRGRADDPEIQVTRITGSRFGWATLEADFGSLQGPDFQDGMKMTVPNPNLPMINNVPQMVELAVTGLFARALRGGNEEILQPTAMVYVPTDGNTFNVLAGDQVILNHTSTIATLNLIVGPGVTGNTFTVTCRQAAVTTLNITSGVGNIIDWAPGTLGINGQLKFKKNDTIGAWTQSPW